MRGTWKNEQGGSYGPFACTQSATSHTSSALVCDACKRIIPTHATRWNCTVCSPEWNCCAQCLTPSPAPGVTRMDPARTLHAHALEAEVVYGAEVAGGESCAQMVHNALQTFGTRPLLGQRASPSATTFTWLSYGEVGAFVQDAAWGLRHAVGKDKRVEVEESTAAVGGCIALYADNSPTYVVAMLASLLVESIIVPIHPVLDTPSLSHILSKTTPLVFFVGEEYAEKLQPSLVEVPIVVVLPKKWTDKISSSYSERFVHPPPPPPLYEHALGSPTLDEFWLALHMQLFSSRRYSIKTCFLIPPSAQKPRLGGGQKKKKKPNIFFWVGLLM